MATLYENLQGGTISDNPLSSGALNINSTAFQYLPQVDGGNIMYLTLDPEGVHGAPEIVTVTGHYASGTAVAVTRGSQDTVAREHPLNTVWIHGLTEADVDQLGAPVQTAGIADGAVTTAKLAADAVNGSKIADDSVDSEHYVDGSIDTAHLADAAVTAAKASFGWQTDWTPTFQANAYAVPDVGDGSWDAKYLRIGNVGWISATFTTGTTSVVISRSLDIDLPPGWTATGPVHGFVYMARNSNVSYRVVAAIGEDVWGPYLSRPSSNTKISTAYEQGSTAPIYVQIGNGYGTGLSTSTAGQTITYNMGPIPLA